MEYKYIAITFGILFILMIVVVIFLLVFIRRDCPQCDVNNECPNNVPIDTAGGIFLLRVNSQINNQLFIFIENMMPVLRESGTTFRYINNRIVSTSGDILVVDNTNFQCSPALGADIKFTTIEENNNNQLWSFDGLCFYSKLYDGCVFNSSALLSVVNRTLGLVYVPDIVIGRWQFSATSIVVQYI